MTSEDVLEDKVDHKYMHVDQTEDKGHICQKEICPRGNLRIKASCQKGKYSKGKLSKGKASKKVTCQKVT